MNLIWLFPALVFLSILAKPFFTIWAGKDFGEQSVMPFYILLAGLVFNIPTYLPYSAIMASGRTDVFAKLYFAELIPYIGLVGILTYKFGIVGAACAWSLRISADAWLQFYLARRTADVTFLGIRPAFALAVAILIIPFVLNLLFPAATVAVLGVFFVCAVVYLTLLWKTVLQTDGYRGCWEEFDFTFTHDPKNQTIDPLANGNAGSAPELEEGSDESIAKFYSDRVTHCEFLDDPAHYEFPRAEWVLSKVGGDNVLEIGAGNGGMTRLLAPKVERLTAFDVSAPSLKMIDEMGLPNVETVCGLVESYPPKRNSTALSSRKLSNICATRSQP